jgi:6-phosphogluconolactonase/glucosamine-6-phosphate isomerase/deaminase
METRVFADEQAAADAAAAIIAAAARAAVAERGPFVLALSGGARRPGSCCAR